MDEKELIKEFLVESYENLARFDREIVELESQPRDEKRLASVFRVVHSIKGTCGFLGFSHLERVTHLAEHLLSQLRDGVRPFTKELASLLLDVADGVRKMLNDIESTGRDSLEAPVELIERLEDSRLNREPGSTAQAPAKPEAELAPAQRATAIGDSTIRVNVSLLDRLMNLVGELVLARNQITQVSGDINDTVLLSASQRLDLVTTELQEGVMKTRMQPVGVVWEQLPRMVRDLGCTFAKQIRLEMEGSETELDKTIIEAVKDPITHIVRNCCDHGIETPEVRQRAGKPQAGRVWLRARHESGQVLIEIGDDGAGINRARLQDVVRTAGRFTSEQLSRMTDEETLNLVFLPGLTTASRVTNISGRGVGMDVVRTNVERIGGTVDLSSQEGAGTVIRLRIPLTLAIIPGLLITAHACRADLPFVIPQVAVAELVRIDQDDPALETVQQALVYRLRGKLLPVTHLNDVLGLGREAGRSGTSNMIVLETEHRQFGLIVDTLHDTQEIVVKPLGHHMKGLNCYAGATILGDGRVALILDVAGLAETSGVFLSLRPAAEAAQAARITERRDTQTLLLLRAGTATQLAIPLAHVSRLEEFPATRIETTDGRTAIQYRGRILPLAPLAELLSCPPARTNLSGMTRTIVLDGDGLSAGLIVEEISDIIEASLAGLDSGGRFGLRGSAIVNGRVTDLLDAAALLTAAVAYRQPAASASDVGALARALQPQPATAGQLQSADR